MAGLEAVLRPQLGERDLEAGIAQLKELASGEQREVALATLVEEVRAAVAEPTR